LSLRAWQSRGTNSHKRVMVYDNKVIDCAYCTPYTGSGLAQTGLFCLNYVAGADIRRNKFIYSAKSSLKLISMGTNVTGILFMENDVSTFTPSAEYTNLSDFILMTTDVAQFLALGCLCEKTLVTLNQATEPATTQIPAGACAIWTDTDDAKCYLCYNHGGTVKTVELT